MAVMTRADGVKFVMQPYREQLVAKDAATLNSELTLSARTNGQFVQLFKQSAGQFEAVFSKDPGYLFAETLWNYFSKPDNLIYCEVLPDSAGALFVAVRHGEILFDAQLTIEQVEREILALLSEDVAYVIKVYGEIPTLENVESRFEKLAASVSPILTRNHAYQLLPLEQVLQRDHFKKKPLLAWVVSVAGIFIVSALVWFINLESDNSKIQFDASKELPITATLPSINDQLAVISRSINDIVTFPGWALSEIHYQHNSVSLFLNSVGGTVFDLEQWANLNHYKFLVTDFGAEVISDDLASKSTLKTQLVDSQQTLSQLADRLIKLLPPKSFSVGEITTHSGHKEIAIVLKINRVSTEILDLMTKMLADLPLTLQAAVIHVNNGFLTGKIDLTVIGS